MSKCIETNENIKMRTQKKTPAVTTKQATSTKKLNKRVHKDKS